MRLEDLLIRLEFDTSLSIFDIETGDVFYYHCSSYVPSEFNKYYLDSIGTFNNTLSVSIIDLDDML